MTGSSGETICKDVELTESLLFYFYPGVIPNGQHIEACITLLDINEKNCVDGLNHKGRQHEIVQLHPPI